MVVAWVSDELEALENPEQAVNMTSDDTVKTRVRGENSRGAFAHTFSAQRVRRQNIDHLVTKLFRDLLDVLREKP